MHATGLEHQYPKEWNQGGEADQRPPQAFLGFKKSYTHRES